MSASDSQSEPRRETASPSAETQSAWTREAIWTWLAGGVLALAVTMLYAPAATAPFVFDDIAAIVQNPSIQHLWPPAGETPGPLNPPRNIPTSGRPLVNASFALNHALGGLNPTGYHVANLLLHALAAWLLYAVVRRTLRLAFFAGRFEQSAEPLALATALVWAVHPLQTESVEYVTQRTEVLMGLCYLGTLAGSLRYWQATTPGSRWLWGACAAIACAAGMGSKEMMVSAPVMVLLFERTFLRGSFWQALKQSWPLYLGLFASWLLLLAFMLQSPRDESAGFQLNIPAVVWWMTECQVFLLYLKLSVWPWPLLIHYELPLAESLSAAWPAVLAVSALAAATAMLTWRRFAVGYLGTWVFAILSPTLVVPMITETAAERRMYLPLAALVALAVVGGYALLQRLAAATACETGAGPRWPLRATLATGAVAAVLLAGLSAWRLQDYSDPLTLWQTSAQHVNKNSYVEGNLAVELLNAGRPAEAIPHLEEALRLEKRDPSKIHADLGMAHLLLNHPDEAITHLQQALALGHDDVAVRGNLGHALLLMQRPAEAIEHLERAARLAPSSVAVRKDLANAYLQTDQAPRAIEQFRAMERLEPPTAESHHALGLALAHAGDLPGAIEQIERARRLEPDRADLRQLLGMLLIKAQRSTAAIDLFQSLVRDQPNSVEANYYLGVAMANAGLLPQAIQQFEATLKLDPGHAAAQQNLELVRKALERRRSQ